MTADNTKSQGISTRGIGLICPEYSGFSTRRVKDQVFFQYSLGRDDNELLVGWVKLDKL